MKNQTFNQPLFYNINILHSFIILINILNIFDIIDKNVILY